MQFIICVRNNLIIFLFLNPVEFCILFTLMINDSYCFNLARFTPTDQNSKERIRIKERFGLLMTQQPAPIY